MIYTFLLILVLLQSFLILYPLVKRKFSKSIKILSKNNIKSVHIAVADSASKMLFSRNVSMSFSDDETLYAMLATWKNKLIGKKTHQSYAYYNFPLAFLIIGLIDDHINEFSGKILNEIETKCEDLIDSSGELKFNLDKIDQATFGLVFLRMYELTNKEYYLKGAHKVYEKIQEFKGNDGLYRYRLGLNIFFIDTVGLLCPFLIHYAKVTDNLSIRSDAEYQIEYALNKCVEPYHGLAYHAFDISLNQPLGSTNWARGMGWLMLGLSAVASESNNDKLIKVMERYTVTLMNMRENYGFWAQFIGHTNDKEIDSSATLMFLYAFHQCNTIDIDSSMVSHLAKLCIDSQGQVVKASGDTIYINKYSRVKGPSELSQGIMLSLLSKVNK